MLLIKRIRKRLRVSRAIDAAERSARALLIDDVPAIWQKPDMPHNSEVTQVSDEFKIAVERARKLFAAGMWEQLSSHERADAIYKELLAVDAERLARPAVISML